MPLPNLRLTKLSGQNHTLSSTVHPGPNYMLYSEQDLCRILLSSSPHPFSLQPVSLLENSVTLLVSQQTLWQVPSISPQQAGTRRAAKDGIKKQMNGDISLGG